MSNVMTSLTKYSKSTPDALLISMKKYIMTLFVMAQSTRTLMTGKSVPTSQPGSRRRPLMSIWILMAARSHARLQSMDVKLVQMKNMHFSVLKMGPKFACTPRSGAMVILSAIMPKMKIWSCVGENIKTRR